MSRDFRQFGALTVLLCDSITEVSSKDGGVFAVSGSHGGVNCAGYAMRAPLAGVAYNDAGVGKDGAGIAALAILQEHGMPAVTVGHLSAVIGEAADTLANGVISHVNDSAAALGFRKGLLLQEALVALAQTRS
jgi:hypothetical protein